MAIKVLMHSILEKADLKCLWSWMRLPLLFSSIRKIVEVWSFLCDFDIQKEWNSRFTTNAAEFFSFGSIFVGFFCSTEYRIVIHITEQFPFLNECPIKGVVLCTICSLKNIWEIASNLTRAKYTSTITWLNAAFVLTFLVLHHIPRTKTQILSNLVNEW